MEADPKEVEEEEPTGLAGELDIFAPRLPTPWPLFTLAIAVATDSHESTLPWQLETSLVFCSQGNSHRNSPGTHVCRAQI